MCAELTVRPIDTRPELARVVEYFHSADDTALRNMGVDRALLPDPQAWLERHAGISISTIEKGRRSS